MHAHTRMLAEQLAFPDGATHIAQTQAAWISLTDLYFGHWLFVKLPKALACIF